MRRLRGVGTLLQQRAACRGCAPAGRARPPAAAGFPARTPRAVGSFQTSRPSRATTPHISHEHPRSSGPRCSAAPSAPAPSSAQPAHSSLPPPPGPGRPGSRCQPRRSRRPRRRSARGPCGPTKGGCASGRSRFQRPGGSGGGRPRRGSLRRAARRSVGAVRCAAPRAAGPRACAPRAPGRGPAPAAACGTGCRDGAPGAARRARRQAAEAQLEPAVHRVRRKLLRLLPQGRPRCRDDLGGGVLQGAGGPQDGAAVPGQPHPAGGAAQGHWLPGGVLQGAAEGDGPRARRQRRRQDEARRGAAGRDLGGAPRVRVAAHQVVHGARRRRQGGERRRWRQRQRRQALGQWRRRRVPAVAQAQRQPRVARWRRRRRRARRGGRGGGGRGRRAARV
jgi:hypothetical protein